jgi:hypothetical protein
MPTMQQRVEMCLPIAMIAGILAGSAAGAHLSGHRCSPDQWMHTGSALEVADRPAPLRPCRGRFAAEPSHVADTRANGRRDTPGEGERIDLEDS